MPERPFRRVAGWLVAAGAGVLVFASVTAMSDPPPLMNWPDLLSRPMPAANQHIAYGEGPLQFGELWLPPGKGPFPVVLMVHGGCWRSGVAKLTIQNYIAADLRGRGYAVWNIEYRGVDRPGGGYPGTFQDVAAGADKLAEIAPAYHLDLTRMVALGHSAGGHLVLWLAARGRLPAWSPMHVAHPLPIRHVISLGGLPDLEHELARGDDGCGAPTITQLLGQRTATRTDLYADTSPAELGVGHDTELMLNGDSDGIAPPDDGAAYAAKMKAKGANIRAITFKHTGHVELIAPGTAAWTQTVELLREYLR